MKFLRREKRTERGTIAPGESYEVQIEVCVFWNPDTMLEEEAIDGDNMRKIEAAVEAVHPGWFHTCHETPRQLCPACNRKQFDKQNRR